MPCYTVFRIGMGTTPRGNDGVPEPTVCPVCVSNHVERARAMNADYRCPDCSALFDANGRIVADPRRGRLDDRGPEQPEG